MSTTSSAVFPGASFSAASKASARSMLGDALLRDGKVDESLPHFRAALERKPGIVAYAGLGRALLQLRQYSAVVEEMRKAILFSPDSPQPHLYLSQAHRALGDVEAARKEADLFTRLNRERAGRRDREVERDYVE